MNIRIGSLFSGYGGLDLSVRAVLGGDVVWHCDNDPAATALLAHQHPNVPNLGDITAVDWDQVEPVEVLTGGFPCQDVSAAGRRAGMTPTSRSGLWTHMTHAISALRPRTVVIENVRGLYSARAHRDVEPGPEALGDRHAEPVLRALGAVLGDLSQLGYDAQWCGLRAADVGAPHARYRVFIVARDTTSPGRGQGRSGGRVQPVQPRSGRVATADPDHLGHQRCGCARGRWCGSADHRHGAVADTGGESVGEQPVAQPERGGAAVAGLDHSPVADTSGTGRWSWRRMGGRAGASAVGDSAPAATDSEGDRRYEGRTEPEGQQRGPHPALRSHAAATDASGGCDAHEPHRGDPTGLAVGAVAGTSVRDRAGTAPEGTRLVGGSAGELAWGSYEPAIRRWEHLLGRPAPAPAQPGQRGGPQLSPRFVEWMQGLPAGHVTDVPGLTRNQQLRILGNGVVPQQAAAALHVLLAHDTSAETAA